MQTILVKPVQDSVILVSFFLWQVANHLVKQEVELSRSIHIWVWVHFNEQCSRYHRVPLIQVLHVWIPNLQTNEHLMLQWGRLYNTQHGQNQPWQRSTIEFLIVAYKNQFYQGQSECLKIICRPIWLMCSPIIWQHQGGSTFWKFSCTNKASWSLFFSFRRRVSHNNFDDLRQYEKNLDIICDLWNIIEGTN